MMIREYKRTDLDAIMAIWLDSNIKAHDFIPASYWARNLALVRTRYIPASTTFVYEQDDEILGFISLLDDSFIGALFVAASHQGQGVGSALIKQAQSRCDSLSLNVDAKNKKAVAFYDRWGFGIEETRVDEATREEEYVMSWQSDNWLELLNSMMC